MVEKLGTFPLPVEILPFGHTHVIKKLKEFSPNPILRKTNGKIFVTDNGNYVVDVPIMNTTNIHEISAKLNSITGVVETGLFLKMCNRIIIGTDSGAKIVENDLK